MQDYLLLLLFIVSRLGNVAYFKKHEWHITPVGNMNILRTFEDLKLSSEMKCQIDIHALTQ